MSEYLDIVLILFPLLYASSFLLSDVAGIVAGVLGEGSTNGSPAAVQAKIEEDVEVIGQYGGLPMKLTKSKSIAVCTSAPTPSPTPFGQCDAGKERLEVTLLTDKYPSETSWELVNTATNQIEITQTSFGINKLYVNNWCTPVAMYEFTIYDSYGDGICCGYGAGSYTVKWGGETVGSGGAFGSSATHAFGSTPTNPPTLPVSLYQINDMKGFGSFFSFCSTYLYQSLHAYRVVLTSVIVLCFPLSLVTL